jgi:hypothetical protein
MLVAMMTDRTSTGLDVAELLPGAAAQAGWRS